jgi:4-hydroxy-4-methyl-2-oxoglutarate aldolase
MTKETEWTNDRELFALMRKELYTAVVGDILDTLGCEHQFLPPEIRPLDASMTVAGRAMPVLMMDVFGVQEEPFGKMTEALDSLMPDEVYIAAGTTRRCANWGEIMTATALMRKAVGAVVYGYHRDTAQVLAQNFPVFSIGSYAQDSGPRMKVSDFRVPIEIESVLVRPGDIVFGDVDGVLILPRELETAVIAAALEKARAEKAVRTAIEHGMSSTAALKKYGVL